MLPTTTWRRPAGHGLDRGDIDRFAERVARSLEKDHLGVGLDLPFETGPVRGVDPCDLYAQSFEDEGDLVVRAVDVMEDEEVPSGAQVGQIDHRAGGHAGGADHAVLGLFEGGDLLLDRADGRVVVAVIGIAVDLAVGDLAQHFEVEVLVIDRVHDGRDHRAVPVGRQRVGGMPAGVVGA